MALVDHIERIGQAVENGEMDRSRGVRELVHLSAGGLTSAGAADVIENWRTAYRPKETRPSDLAWRMIREGQS
jgi:hypothetical protein